ncbi:ribonuclease P protein component [Mycoplasma anserisalpingitidis]|uniref:Ribonuclease P protein component n=1 Tax=Mycoplasma anserisalpingitidis TaxID=519450 RepID=A0A5B8JC20_9MOLU|nr:ribonuclease P protein component [Mycoplasma anserisalpingitidis]QDY88612.1 ribonuclease P protein component [Mycoplasma anserisalpingitidis]
MKRKYRLKKNWEFESVILSKLQVSNKMAVIHYVPHTEVKIGITVPKKFEKAVGRNFYKRQMRAILQSFNIKDLKYKIVIIVRKNFITEENFEVKQKMVHKLLEQLLNEKN